MDTRPRAGVDRKAPREGARRVSDCRRGLVIKSSKSAFVRRRGVGVLPRAADSLVEALGDRGLEAEASPVFERRDRLLDAADNRHLRRLDLLFRLAADSLLRSQNGRWGRSASKLWTSAEPSSLVLEHPPRPEEVALSAMKPCWLKTQRLTQHSRCR